MLRYVDAPPDDLDRPGRLIDTCATSRAAAWAWLLWVHTRGLLGASEVLVFQVVTDRRDVGRPSVRLRREGPSRWASEGAVDFGFGPPVALVVEGVPEPAPWL